MPTVDHEPPAYWPASGHLVVQDLSVKYTDGSSLFYDFSRVYFF